MTFVARAASFAAVALALIGVASPSAPVYAAEIARTAIADTFTADPSINVTMGPSVPVIQPIPGETPVSHPAEPASLAQMSMPGDVIAYPTLAAAVAAQAEPASADDQLRCLATSVYFESKGEPLAGQLAVAEVILNRAEAGRFGASVCDVIRQPGQFSFVRGGRIPAVDATRPAYRTAMAIAKVALADAWDSNVGRALYFHARRVSPGWNRTRIASIGNHVFYR